MTWQKTAERYLAAFEAARKPLRTIGQVLPTGAPSFAGRLPVLPATQLSYLLSMCGDTGLFQHAVHSVPDPAHGYCLDENARALLLASVLNTPGGKPLANALASRFASFVQHACNPDEKRFRNFMGFDRRWLEDKGSEDSHGRARGHLC
jgi:hypothetical protein